MEKQTQYFEARKLISKRTEGEKEFQEWHVIRADLDYNYVEELFTEWYDNDWEYAFNHGFNSDQGGDLISINVSDVLDELHDLLIQAEEEEEEDDIEKYKEYQNKLEKYKDYNLYVELEVKQEAMQSQARHSSQA